MAGKEPNKTKLSTSEQSQRFIETARTLGCEDDEATFREKLRVIARQKPKDEPKPKRAKRDAKHLNPKGKP